MISKSQIRSNNVETLVDEQYQNLKVSVDNRIRVFTSSSVWLHSYLLSSVIKRRRFHQLQRTWMFTAVRFIAPKSNFAFKTSRLGKQLDG